MSEEQAKNIIPPSMEIVASDRGFIFIHGEKYPPQLEEDSTKKVDARLLSESSAIGDYEDSFDCAGGSYLWVNNHIHLNREEIDNLILAVAHWIETGKLPLKIDDLPESLRFSNANDSGFFKMESHYYPPTELEDGSGYQMTQALCESSKEGHLWVGEDLHLNREEAEFFLKAMQFWKKHKRLPYRERELVEDRIILDSELKEEQNADDKG